MAGMQGDDVLKALAEQHAELDAMITGLTDEQWSRPSRCDGWSIADVLLHLVQTDEMALASVEGRFDEYINEAGKGLPPATTIDDSVAALVDKHRGAPGDEIAEQWRQGSTRLRDAFAATDPKARLTWVAGQMAARSLATTRLAECWIHTGDVAVGLGVPHPPTDRLWHILRLAWRTLPYAFGRDGKEMTGPVGFDLRSPSGEQWRFADESTPPLTTITGDAAELAMVAARRVAPSETSLHADGPDGADVLALIRTWA